MRPFTPANDVTCAVFLARLKKERLAGLEIAVSQSSETFSENELGLKERTNPLSAFAPTERTRICLNKSY